MGKRLFVLVLSLYMTSFIPSAPEAAAVQKSPASLTGAAAEYHALVSQYCVTCHSETLKTGGLTLEKMDFNDVGAGAEIWEKVVRKLRSGMMPPQGRPKPDDAARNGFAAWLETNLDRAAAAKPDPGRPLLRRLNRTE